MKRALGVVAALALLGGVAFALIPDDKDAEPVTVTGLIGSEKRDFFDDPDVKAELKKQHLVVKAEPTGSWTMAEQARNTPNLDFAFPASSAPALDIQRDWKLKDSPRVQFYSPLVIVTHASVADVLKKNQLADEKDGVWTFQMDKYVAALKQGGQRWKDLTGAAAHPELDGLVYVSTTDPESSSSGALYLAILSYLANGNQVVSDDAGVKAVQDVLYTANRVQGLQKVSSDGPFREFGAGVNTLVFAYESQAAALPLQGRPTGDMVVMYPTTTIKTDHTLVARTDGGRKLADALVNDPELRRLEARFGLRPDAEPGLFWDVMKDKQPHFVPDVRTAGLALAPVPSLDYMSKLTAAAKGGSPK
ncbi:substrate-binding domain-containing protein [Kitasatospora brasiliensis]|uniref:substrate-binding domain-containing protein n=1 Tax=Kitasatospora brasiliensis TaxID=3058040 RepID=UPI0029308D66|nr:substrate-binding domain-containing protein [Kitasatospora sp. K002]